MRFTRTVLAGLTLAGAMVFAVTRTAPATEARAITVADLTGKWLFTVTTDAGSGTPTVTMRQKGDSLTGHYSSQRLGEHDFTGTVNGQKFTFAFSADVQGTSIAVTFTGATESDGSLKGTIDFAGGAATGTFTAKRQP